MKNQTGSYTIELSDGKKIPLRFCTWSLRRFCELNGNLTLKELQEVLNEGLSITRLTSLLLCAAEYVCVKEKREFTYTDFDAAEWIDELGGIAGKGFGDMLLAITVPLTADSITADKIK